MDDRRRALLRDPRRQAVVDLVDEREVARLALLPLTVPPVEGAGDVVLLASQVAEPDRVGVDRVDRDQGVGNPVADRAAVALVEQLAQAADEAEQRLG